MKMFKYLGIACAGLLAMNAVAQSYSVDWYKISGGGGTCTGGTYQVSGTIGQPDAGSALAGGNYSVTGGFWSLVSVVQTAGMPNLVIISDGPNCVQIRWPATGSYTLQENSSLAAANWVPSGFAITNGFGTNFCTIPSPAGNLFFRLKSP